MYAVSRYEIKGGPSLTVTLLLPRDLHEELTSFFRPRQITRGAYLRNLVQAYAFHLVRDRPVISRSVRTRYQPPNLDLVRFNLKVDWNTWVKLQTLARGLGISVCMLAVYLVRLQFPEISDQATTKGVVPTLRRIVGGYNRKVTLRAAFAIEMTRPAFMRRVNIRQGARDPHIARMMRLVRANRKNWLRNL